MITIEKKKEVLKRLQTALERDGEEKSYTDKEILEQLRKTTDLQGFIETFLNNVSVYHLFQESLKIMSEANKTQVETLIESYRQKTKEWGQR
jgi:hypothetical protein